VDPENGSLTSVSPGTATITASVDELRASSLVTVIELAGTIAFARQEGNWPGAVITYRAGFRRAVLTEPSGLFLAEPDWSPDGSALVVQASTRLPGDNSQSDIFIVRADKLRGPDDWHQLTRDRQSRSATWSPDGKRIAYVSGPVSGADIHMIEIAGGAPVRLTQQPGLYLGPRWSPYGRRIAFIEFRPDETSDIYVVNVDGGGREKVSQDGAYNYGSPSWSPDGKHLAFLGCRDGGCGLDVLDLGSRALRRLIAYGAPGDWVAGSTWSPDGRQILYSLTTWSGGRNADGRSGVYIMNADGSGATQLTRPPAGAFDGQPTWRR
jgi:Tol biopolymer transport system component